MRTVTGTELARLNATHMNLHLRVEVKDADGIYQDLTTVGGVDWVESASWSESIDRPVQTGTIELRRDADTAPTPLEVNGGIETGTATGWSLDTGWTVDTGAHPHSGAFNLRRDGAGSSSAFNTPVACSPGDSFYAEGWMEGVSGANGVAQVFINFLTSGGASNGVFVGAAVPSDGVYHFSSIRAMAPAGSASVKAGFTVAGQTTGTWYADDLRWRRAPLTIAPFIQASALNQNAAGAYAPLLELGRLGRISTALVDHGASPAGGDWKELLQFRVDEVDWQTNPAVLQISDIGSLLMDAQIEDLNNYGNDAGVPVEDVMQFIIDDTLGAGVVTLYVPSSPGWNIFTYQQDRVPLLSALRDLALQIGWDVRYRYDASNNFRLTFYEPDRGKTTPDAVIGPTTYRDVTGLKRSIADIRNVVKVVYAGGSVTRSNTASIAKYGRRFMEIANAPNIDTGSEATDMGQAAVDDLSEPIADQEIDCLYWWPAQLGDLYQFTANGDHYDVDQILAVVNIQHELREGQGVTRVQTRGSVSGAFRNWLRVAGEGGGTTTGRDMFTALLQSPDYGADVVTFLWAWDGDPTATFNLWREFNPVSGTPASYVLDGASPLVAGTSSFNFTTTLVDIDLAGASQCNVGFYLEAIVGSTIVAVSVKNEVIYQRN